MYLGGGNVMKTGTIKSFNVHTGDGMIASEFAIDVYFNKHSVVGGADWLYVGVQVQYELYPSNGKEPEARLVRRVG